MHHDQCASKRPRTVGRTGDVGCVLVRRGLYACDTICSAVRSNNNNNNYTRSPVHGPVKIRNCMCMTLHLRGSYSRTETFEHL